VVHPAAWKLSEVRADFSYQLVAREMILASERGHLASNPTLAIHPYTLAGHTRSVNETEPFRHPHPQGLPYERVQRLHGTALK